MKKSQISTNLHSEEIDGRKTDMRQLGGAK